MYGKIFHKSVIYVIKHDKLGAFGLILNRLVKESTADKIFNNTDPKITNALLNMDVHIGGPIDTNRGLCLHTTEYYNDNVLLPSGATLGLTANFEIIRDVADKIGPKHHMLFIGHTIWKPNELETEMANNLWVVTDMNEQLVFETPIDTKWIRALSRIGLDVSDFGPSVVARS